MTKVAITSHSQAELEDIKAVLDRYFEVSIDDMDTQGGMRTAVLTVTNSKRIAITKMFELFIAATGIDPRKPLDRSFHTARIRAAAGYLLCKRFNLSYAKAARLLGYQTHVSVLRACNQLGKINVDERIVSIELAIRRTLK